MRRRVLSVVGAATLVCLVFAGLLIHLQAFALFLALTVTTEKRNP